MHNTFFGSVHLILKEDAGSAWPSGVSQGHSFVGRVHSSPVSGLKVVRVRNCCQKVAPCYITHRCCIVPRGYGTRNAVTSRPNLFFLQIEVKLLNEKLHTAD